MLFGVGWYIAERQERASEKKVLAKGCSGFEYAQAWNLSEHEFIVKYGKLRFGRGEQSPEEHFT